MIRIFIVKGVDRVKVNYSRQVDIPSLTDFGNNFNPFKGMVPKYKDVFDYLTILEAIVAVLSFTDMKLNLSAITGVAAELHRSFFNKYSASGEWDDVKKFAGAVIRIIHEQNGYKATGKKGETSYKDFSVGEIYEL